MDNNDAISKESLVIAAALRGATRKAQELKLCLVCCHCLFLSFFLSFCIAFGYGVKRDLYIPLKMSATAGDSDRCKAKRYRSTKRRRFKFGRKRRSDNSEVLA